MKKIKDTDPCWKIKYPEHNIYVMRGHNWAFSAWEIARLDNVIKPGATLLHVDFHDDYCEPLEKIAKVETKQEALRSVKN